MSFRRVVLPLIAIFLCAHSLFSQDSFGKPGSLPVGRTAAAKTTAIASMLALGGAQFLAGLGACETQGTYTDYQRDQDIGAFLWISQDDNFRIERTSSDGTKTIRVAYQGAQALSVNGVQQVVLPNTTYTAADLPHMPGMRILRHFNDSTISFALADASKLPSKFSNNLILRIGYPNSSDPAQALVENDLVINPSTGLPSMYRVIGPGYPVASRVMTTDYYLSNYKLFHGILAPSVILKKEYGIPVTQYTLTSLQCGVSTDSSLFTLSGDAQ